MSYSIDANLLLYASDSSSEFHPSAKRFIDGLAADPDLLCLTWSALLAYQRIATHPSIFRQPLSPTTAWSNVQHLLKLPRTRVIVEDSGFWEAYGDTSNRIAARGNLVPDAHLATVLRQHGVTRIYSADADFRKFDFLEVINPL